MIRKETHVEKSATRTRRALRAAPRWMAIALLGAAILTPAVGGAATFLTKQKANKLFLGNTREVTQTVAIPNGETRVISVLCPSGFQATGGGADSPALVTTIGGDLMLILDSAPMGAGRSIGWQVEVLAQSAGPTLDVTASAVCSK